MIFIKISRILVSSVLLFSLSLAAVLSGCKNGSGTSPVDSVSATAEKSSINTELKKLEDKVATVKTNKEKSEIYSRISLLSSQKGDVSRSVKNARKAVESDPKNPQSHFALGKSLLDSFMIDESIVELNKSIDGGLDTPQVRFELGNSYYKKRDYQKASLEYKKSIDKDPNNAESLNNYALMMSMTNRNGDAEKYLLQAVSANPEFVLSYKNLGILYETKLKQKDKAVEYYTKYIQKIADGREKKVVGLWIQNLGGGK